MNTNTKIATRSTLILMTATLPAVRMIEQDDNMCWLVQEHGSASMFHFEKGHVLIEYVTCIEVKRSCTD